MKNPKTPGRIACETWYMKTYQASVDGAERYWRSLKRKEVRVWDKIANAAIDAQPCQHPWMDIGTHIGLVKGVTNAKCLKCDKDL